MPAASEKRAVGRFAPTPSGVMHVGNLLCALIAYLSVKSVGGTFAVRIEDLDAARCPRSAALDILGMLSALGLESDVPPVYQSERTAAYERAENALREQGVLYPCFCTRAELHAAHAPRLADGGVVYDGACKALSPSEVEKKRKKRAPCVRLSVPDETVAFTDGVAGYYEQNLARECGDFIIRRSDGVYAYQLAVTVDDAFGGVTEAVRGADLISSTPRQMYLQKLLGYETPAYYHIPLVCDSDGRKLSKTDGDGAARLVDAYPPERVIGMLAFAAGVINTDCAISLAELTRVFDWKNVRKHSIFLPKHRL